MLRPGDFENKTHPGAATVTKPFFLPKGLDMHSTPQIIYDKLIFLPWIFSASFGKRVILGEGLSLEHQNLSSGN